MTGARLAGPIRRFAAAGAAALGLFALSSGAARGQEVRVEALVNAQECRVLLPVGGRIFGGLASGGVVAWDAANPQSYRHWTVADGLTSLRVSALAWTGQHLWVATPDAGLTRVTLGDGDPAFRQFVSIGGLDVTSVVGTVRGTTEVVYYGLAQEGVGIITGGLPGVVYTSQLHGLASDNVRALALHRGALWVATDLGASRFAANVFTTENAGLADLDLRSLLSAGDTLLLAGTASAGVARWDSAGSAWAPVGDLTGQIDGLAANAEGVWALRQTAGNPELWRFDGALWTLVAGPEPATFAVAADAAGALWAAGTHREAGMDYRTGQAALARREAGGWTGWRTDELLCQGIDGSAFAADGSLWLGSRDGLALACRPAAGGWAQIYKLAADDEDSLGLFYHGDNMTSLAVLPDGEVWVTQSVFFGQHPGGVIRDIPGDPADPTDDDFDHITPANSGLRDKRVVRLLAHPDGPLLFMSDNSGVSVLLDHERPHDLGQWLALPEGTGGLAGSTVREAVVTRRDVVWFAVEGVGLVSWDINGSAGPSAPLTWADAGDDVWTEPLALISGTDFEFRQVKAMALAPDSTLWIGGANGLVRVRPLASGSATLLNSVSRRKDVYTDGLLGDIVKDLDIDANGDVWAGQDAGLNRLRLRNDALLIDAFVNLTSWSENSLADLYTSDIITGVPGGRLWEIAADPNANRILMGTDEGAAVLTIAARAPDVAPDLDAIYLYPNPFPGDDAATGVRVGGITATVTNVNTGVGLLPQGGMQVQVFNLDGQLVHQSSHVANDKEFWDGSNAGGAAVVSGLYLVKVSFNGQSVTKTLAVVR